MRLCNCYALLREKPVVELKNKNFVYRFRLEAKDGAISRKILSPKRNMIPEADFDHRLFCAMLQNEDWIVCDDLVK